MKFLITTAFLLGLTVTPHSFSSDLESTRKLAEQGNSSDQLLLGAFYYFGQGVSKDYKEAVKWLRKSADQGNAAAQRLLGCCYDLGQGVPKDYKEAVKWFRKSAEQGDEFAQYGLGFCYKEGKGVSKDYVQAYMWFNLSLAEIDNASVKETIDNLEKEMTREQIEEAQKLSREWFNKKDATD